MLYMKRFYIAKVKNESLIYNRFKKSSLSEKMNIVGWIQKGQPWI